MAVAIGNAEAIGPLGKPLETRDIYVYVSHSSGREFSSRIRPQILGAANQFISLDRSALKTPPVTKAQSFYGWKLVAALWVLDFLNMGFPLFGGAVINTYMLKQIAMERSTYGLGFTLLNLFVGLPSMLVAASILKWGIRASFAIGSSLIFLGALWLSYFATKPWHYLLGFGVIIATGISFATIVPVTTAVTRWFNRYRGRAMAIPLAASGCAGFLGAPFINKILAANGGNWRQAWQVVAGIAVASAIFAFIFVKERPEDLGQTVDGAPPDTAAAAAASPSRLITSLSWTPSQAFKTPAYWLIVVGGLACQFPYFFFIAHWILHLRQHGISAADAAWAQGLFTLGGIGGRLIGGWLMDKMPARFAFMSGLCCYFLGSFLAMNVSSAAFSRRGDCRNFLWHSFWVDLCMYEHHHGALLRPRGVPQGQWNAAAAHGNRGITGGRHRRQTVRSLRKLHASV
jgi:MFS family permease